jgi:hypothetical protein
MQSGACVGLTEPLHLNHDYHNSRYNGLIKALGFDSLSVEDRLAKLRTVPWEDLIEVMKKLEKPDAIFPIAADHDLDGGFWKHKDQIDNGKIILVGNTRHDVLVL